ncbi:hypothetical protein BscR1v2_003810 [Bartonella schoenbuchensis R1]|uniref:Uncharacterized protein n=1 Tax=Bartonella schoenbuchensis (strain DSM 13525 / NCTC 13165 / R1) TaxID=687861 RepID=A0A1S6XPB5_BARSR|nr:hypothetical protein BscR1v2_003810 [Bartonella schoenbuchensis R1]
MKKSKNILHVQSCENQGRVMDAPLNNGSTIYFLVLCGFMLNWHVGIDLLGGNC